MSAIVVSIIVILMIIVVFVSAFYCGKLCTSKVAIIETIIFVRPPTPKTQPSTPINNQSMICTV